MEAPDRLTNHPDDGIDPGDEGVRQMAFNSPQEEMDYQLALRLSAEGDSTSSVAPSTTTPLTQEEQDFQLALRLSNESIPSSSLPDPTTTTQQDEALTQEEIDRRIALQLSESLNQTTDNSRDIFQDQEKQERFVRVNAEVQRMREELKKNPSLTEDEKVAIRLHVQELLQANSDLFIQNESGDEIDRTMDVFEEGWEKFRDASYSFVTTLDQISQRVENSLRTTFGQIFKPTTNNNSNSNNPNPPVTHPPPPSTSGPVEPHNVQSNIDQSNRQN